MHSILEVIEMSDSKVFAFLGVFLTVIGFLIVLLVKKNDKYASTVAPPNSFDFRAKHGRVFSEKLK